MGRGMVFSQWNITQTTLFHVYTPKSVPRSGLIATRVGLTSSYIYVQSNRHAYVSGISCIVDGMSTSVNTCKNKMNHAIPRLILDYLVIYIS